MTFSIQFCLDPDSSERIESLWPLIHPRCASNNTRPHVSLVNFEGTPADELVAKLSAFASDTPALRLHISFVGVAQTNQSIMILPVVTQGLLQLHREVFTFAQELGIEVLPHYQIGAWVPHITVADDTDFEDFEAALKIVLNSDFSKPVTVRSVRLLEFKPFKELCSFDLAG